MKEARTTKIILGFLLSNLIVVANGAEVVVREEPLTLPHYVKSVVPGTEKDKRPQHENKRVDDKTYQSVVLENDYLKIQVIPELGGVIHRAIFKPSNDDFFYYEGLGKEWYTYWESGVKASFPRAEHAMVNWGQPASWRIFRHPDGRATLAMWMEFSRNYPANPARCGRFSVMLLSQLLTLSPEEGCFSITYRIVNPSAWRQGRRIWNDAFYPRNQTAKGAVQAFEQPPDKTRTELIYPASYLSHHAGDKFRKWDDKDAVLGEIRQMYTSYFAWDIPYGFVGMWYPEPCVNRLRIFDPRVAPGAKVYFEGEGTWQPKQAPLSLDCNYNFVEVWGGTDNIFEGIENWIGPGERFQFTHTFATTRGIGKASYADGRLAIHVNFETNRSCLGVVTWRPTRNLEVMLEGKHLDRVDKTGTGCAPDRPAKFLVPSGVERGMIAVRAEGQDILKRVFPLEIPDDKSGHERIRRSVNRGLPTFGEMHGDTPDGNWGVPGAERSATAHPDSSTGRGRVLYRLGRVDEAVGCLRKACETNTFDGEAFHLLGVALMEKGQTNEAAAAFDSAVAAKEPYPAARYYRAILAIGRKDLPGAEKELADLIRAVPDHWEARLLAAYLGGSAEAARKLEAEDPADPRAVWVVVAAAKRAGDTKTADEAARALEQLRKEPGAKRRLNEFESATCGRYQPPLRLQSIPVQ